MKHLQYLLTRLFVHFYLFIYFFSVPLILRRGGGAKTSKEDKNVG